MTKGHTVPHRAFNGAGRRFMPTRSRSGGLIGAESRLVPARFCFVEMAGVTVALLFVRVLRPAKDLQCFLCQRRIHALAIEFRDQCFLFSNEVLAPSDILLRLSQISFKRGEIHRCTSRKTPPRDGGRETGPFLTQAPTTTGARMRQAAWAGASFHREYVRPMNRFCRMSDSTWTRRS
jgi:hypothetical protein